MKLHCNAGTTSTHLIGELLRFGTVWYYPNGITNIYKVANDSTQTNQFIIHKDDGSKQFLKQSKNRFTIWMPILLKIMLEDVL